MVKLIKCSFTSVWDNGAEVTTLCAYNPKTGEVTPEMSRNNPNASLVREYITLPDDEELEVCTTCHEFTLHGVMNPGIGHDLNEEQECRNPDCESHQ